MKRRIPRGFVFRGIWFLLMIIIAIASILQYKEFGENGVAVAIWCFLWIGLGIFRLIRAARD